VQPFFISRFPHAPSSTLRVKEGRKDAFRPLSSSDYGLAKACEPEAFSGFLFSFLGAGFSSAGWNKVTVFFAVLSDRSMYGPPLSVHFAFFPRQPPHLSFSVVVLSSQIWGTITRILKSTPTIPRSKLPVL